MILGDSLIIVTVVDMYRMDKFSTGCANMHPILLDGIPPIPSLVDEFTRVPNDVER
jgi:hypothetical protein